jgi:hypothetical protein
MLFLRVRASETPALERYARSRLAGLLRIDCHCAAFENAVTFSRKNATRSASSRRLCPQGPDRRRGKGRAFPAAHWPQRNAPRHAPRNNHPRR